MTNFAGTPLDAARWQYQPSRVAHDPSPPLTLGPTEDLVTAILRPDGDITAGWNPGAGTAHWDRIDDAVTNAGVADITDYIRQTTLTGKVDEVSLTTVAGIGSGATAWVYCSTAGASSALTISLVKGTTILATVVVPINQANGWRSVTYTGALTKAEVDDLRIRFTANNTVLDNASVYAAYAELTYTPVVAATVPLDTSDATSTATLGVAAAPVNVPLDSAAGSSSASAALTAPTAIPLGSAAATSSATLAPTAPTAIPTSASSATSTGTLTITVPTSVPLTASPGTSAGILVITAPTSIPLGTSSATSTAVVIFTGPTAIVLGLAAGLSSATVSLSARTYVLLAAASASAAATASLLVPTLLALLAADALSTASMDVRVPTNVLLDAAAAIALAELAVSASTPGVTLAGLRITVEHTTDLRTSVA